VHFTSPSIGSPAGDELTVVGIGAGGWTDLAPPARDALLAADVVLGSDRQLELLPPEVDAERQAWPGPLVPALEPMIRSQAGRRRVVLASGDPTFHGIATTIARVLPDLALTVLPHPSSLSLACARLGWSQPDVEVISLVGRPVELVHPAVQPGRRVLVLANGRHSPAEVALLLRGRGFGPSRLIALSNLGAKNEQQVTTTAQDWPGTGWPDGATPEALTVVGIECRAGSGAMRRPRTPGLPDDAYENDGQLTKRQVRALTIAALAPSPGELLWDVGGGAGSVGIEWMRTHPACRAISVERDPVRSATIARNAANLGVPGLEVITGVAPEALGDLAPPDAIFIGGGVTAPGMIETCWRAVAPGGRIVVNVTTLESERVIGQARDDLGGELTRIQITSAAPIGAFTGWRPAMPVTQWLAVKRQEHP
jgi:precorrin-6B C5,15-methyltransferase / cobalt-precorrin-6B C5,C15-methyltransferase